MADAESGKGEGEGKSRLWNKPPKGPQMDVFHSTVFSSWMVPNSKKILHLILSNFSFFNYFYCIFPEFVNLLYSV